MDVTLSELIRLGTAAHQAGRPEEALPCYRRALATAPADAGTLSNLGVALQDLRRSHEALRWLGRALRCVPGHVDILFNRGNALADLQRLDQALADYDAVLRLHPDHLGARWNRANVLKASRRLPDAVASYRRILEIVPSHAEVLNNLGVALKDLGRFDEARRGFERSCAAAPGHADALGNLGSLLRMIGRHEAAVPVFERLLAIAPSHPYAEGNLLHSMLHGCDWRAFDDRVAALSAGVQAERRVATPFAFAAVAASAEDELRCARLFCADIPAPAGAAAVPIRSSPSPRIRIGYFSADFREHPASFLLAGLFERHDRDRFDVLAFSFGHDDGSLLRRRVERAFGRFLDVRGQGDREVAETARRLGIDVAVDLMGHTGESRPAIFAHRAAPVQVNFFCPGTSGAPWLDYIVCDPVVVPARHRPFYSEAVVHLPGTFQANDYRRHVLGPPPPRSALGLPETGFVFCSFNATYKIGPSVFSVWMRLLAAVEGSVLWLRASRPAAEANLRAEARRRGIDPDRLVFAGRVPSTTAHLERHRQADLFLDTLPYNAQTTASDALWAGVPVVTCLGETFSGRVAASLLTAAGLPELICGSLAAYEATALGLAGDREALAAVGARLAGSRDTCRLFDTERTCRDLETAYRTMVDRHRRGEPPAPFAVADAAGLNA